MFSSNQILEISGCLTHSDDLYNALEFALKTAGYLESFENETKADVKCVFQITDDGKYCIGKAYSKPETGWREYPFDFDLSIIAQIITKHLLKQYKIPGSWDGSYEKGFILKAIDMSFSDEKDGIKNPFYGIVMFEPFTCFFAK